MFGELGQHGRLIAGSGADFEYSAVGREGQLFGHIRDDVGLADGLAVLDCQGAVFVSGVLEVFRKELLAGNGQHGVDHTRVRYAPAADLIVDHPPSRGPPFVRFPLSACHRLPRVPVLTSYTTPAVIVRSVAHLQVSRDRIGSLDHDR